MVLTVAPVQLEAMPNSGRASSNVPLHDPPLEESIMAQTLERSMATPPRAGVLPPSPLKAPILFPPRDGVLKYTSRAVASICALSIALHVLLVLVQTAALMMFST